MNAKLIYFYLISFATCLAASCAMDMPGGEAVDRGAELSFEASELTRAAVITSLDKFSVYGDMQYKDNALAVIFDKTEVVRDPDNDKWNKWSYAGPTQYWFPQSMHSFVAITPVAAFESGNEPRYSDSELSFTYTLPDDFESAHDMMAATHRRMYNGNTPSSALPVKFWFSHILSRVNFQVKNDGAADILKVTQIKLAGINRTGTFSIVPASLSPDSEQTDDSNSSWSGISNKGTLTANNLADIPENETESLFPDDNALFMMPQPDNKAVIMELTYELWDNGEKGDEYTLTAETPIGGWEQGKIYTYSIVIKEITKKIYLGPVSVKDWISGSDNDVDVPRK